MKRNPMYGIVLCLLLALLPAVSLADDTGALSEGELGAWVNQVLRDTIGKEPLNAPVGEESRTEDGYAFLYDFATLYYDKPVLDANSVLAAISVTGEGYAAPRGAVLGASEDALLYTFGWQNPYLMGDGQFASFYCVDTLPEAAYWCWGQYDENRQLLDMQCALHVRTGENRYTDAMLRFELEDGVITAIRADGLSRMITLDAVATNLEAVRNVQAAAERNAMSGEDHTVGYAIRHDAAMFGAEDLVFNGMDYRTMDAGTLEKVLGQPQSTETINQRMTATWADAYCTCSSDGVDVLSIATSAVEGPRGIRVGDALDKVIALFHADGEGRTEGSFALLYGDGFTMPTATMEIGDVTVLAYSAAVDGRNISLSLTFADDRLQDWVIYTW